MSQPASKRRRVRADGASETKALPAQTQARKERLSLACPDGYRSLLTERALRLSSDARLQDACRDLVLTVTAAMFRRATAVREIMAWLPAHTRQRLTALLAPEHVSRAVR